MHGRIPEASRITQKCVIASLLAIWLDEQIGRVGLQAEVAFFASARGIRCSSVTVRLA
jgi:hypothetical protein